VSLRTRLLSLFAALAVVPIVALSIFDYFRSMEAVRRLIADQTSQIAGRAALKLSENLEIVVADLRLLADNAETERFYDAWIRRDLIAVAHARPAFRAYIDQAWRVMDQRLASVAFQDTLGKVLDRLGAGGSETGFSAQAFEPAGTMHTLTVPIYSAHGRATIGRVVATAQVEALMPSALMETSVGHHGYTIVADSVGRAVYDRGRASFARGGAALENLNGRPRGDSKPAITLVRYVEDDTQRLASVASIPGSALLVVSSGAVDEYAQSFARVRLVNLMLALLLAASVASAFVIITRRTTRPLETLTAAAIEVGRGNFSPRLPSPDTDEVGRLSAAFATMSERIDQMVAEVESSRQMAAVGSFSRQIAHEIRNPLTSIKLNLQGLERDARAGVVLPDTPRTLEICLEEIHRLERVVRGVLALGRAPTSDRRVVSIKQVVTRALDVLRPQLTAQRIVPNVAMSSDDLLVMADQEQLVAMFLNLLVNAAEAMPDGGSLHVDLERHFDGGVAFGRVTIGDTGPGIPADQHSRVFEPFFTTKAEGSGLGLAVAARDAEAHHGRLVLLSGEGWVSGATFVVELPLVPEANS
jgi:signal transduction histidine kinase